MMVIRRTTTGVHQVFLSIPSCAVLHIGEMPQKCQNNIKGMCEHCQFLSARLMGGKG